MAYAAAVNGACNGDIAITLGICEKTLYTWKKKHSVFNRYLERGIAICNASVERALHKRAIGYETEEVKVTYSEGDEGGEVVDQRVVTTKQVAGDVGAQKFWLTNKNPKDWSDRQKIVTDDGEGGDAPVTSITFVAKDKND